MQNNEIGASKGHWVESARGWRGWNHATWKVLWKEQNSAMPKVTSEQGQRSDAGALSQAPDIGDKVWLKVEASMIWGKGTNGETLGQKQPKAPEMDEEPQAEISWINWSCWGIRQNVWDESVEFCAGTHPSTSWWIKPLLSVFPNWAS